MLPELPYKRGTSKTTQTQFGGIDRRAAAGNGAICDMTNLWSGDAPLISSRPPRYTVGAVTKANGIFSDGDHLFVAGGTTLYVDGESAGTLTDTEKVFAALGNRVVIWPDKKLWTEDGGLEDLESSVTVSAKFVNGTYAGETAEGNTIEAVSLLFDWSDYFSVGDAVTITGAADEENNKTPIVREIEGNALRFYENTFTVNTTVQSITVKRAVPDLDFLCVNDNRVWGCKGDTVCCSKLGDPKNWNVFDGLSTDSWSWDSGTAGEFTGCVSFLGYAIFFKEEAIFKIYGSRPSNFEAMRSAATGVLTGAHKSLAIAGDTLFYLARTGFVAYSGGMPSPIDPALNRKYTGAVGGSDGQKYFVSATHDAGTELLVWDVQSRVWHREDGLAALGMAWKKGLYALTDDSVLLIGKPPDIPSGATAETSYPRSVTFGDWDYQSFASKYPVRVWLRAQAGEGTTITAYIRYNGGAWEQAFTWAPRSKCSANFPVPIRRCDHYALKIEADGDFIIFALETELYAGNSSRKG